VLRLSPSPEDEGTDIAFIITMLETRMLWESQEGHHNTFLYAGQIICSYISASFPFILPRNISDTIVFKEINEYHSNISHRKWIFSQGIISLALNHSSNKAFTTTG
jgi:hypothetical protein